MNEKNIDIAAIQEEVNPVFTTAVSCLQIEAAIGDEEAGMLLKELGFPTMADSMKEIDSTNQKHVPREVADLFVKIAPAYQATVEGRFHATNNYIRKMGTKQVMDLPCGYTARGIKFAKTDVDYYGMDLPAVIDAMSKACGSLIAKEEQGHIHYSAVDATNYQTLKDGLAGVNGELLITTEGMLMYLTQSEIEEVFHNIHRILSEHGGCWITMDNNLAGAAQRVMPCLVDDPEKFKMVGTILSGNKSKTTTENNAFYHKDEVRQFISDMGFDLEIVSIYDYLPENFRAFSMLSDEKKQQAREAFRDVCFWVMTVSQDKAEEKVEESADELKDFKVNLKRAGGRYQIALAGRLDTITATTLLELYRKAEAKEAPTEIVLDLKELDYISSAGLRVLLIMKKALKDPDAMQLENISPSVQEIIETTGFDTIFC